MEYYQNLFFLHTKYKDEGYVVYVLFGPEVSPKQ